jgi:hypothetical protein
MRRVVDCTMYAYEPAALRVRVAELEAVVEHHHVTTGSRTYRGDPQNVTPPDLPRLTHHVAHLPAWRDDNAHGLTRVEALQRDLSLIHALADEPEDTLYVVADGDEIPHPDAIRQAVAEYDRFGPRVLLVDARCWYANLTAYPNGFPPRHHLNQPIIGTAADILALGGAQAARVGRGFRPRVGPKWATCEKVGWHVSDLFDPETVAHKFGIASHTEDDTPERRNVEWLAGKREAMLWPVHDWPLTRTDDLPACIDRFPELVA